MKDTLIPGLEHRHRFLIPKEKTVPALYPESDEFAAMPEVLATGFMVGLIEWACIRLVNPHLDWPAEQTVGIHIDVNHVAATPPGLEVTVHAKLVEIDGKRLVFDVRAHDNLDLISEGRHERFVIRKEKFDSRMIEKARKASR